jgi:hypothetical protein
VRAVIGFQNLLYFFFFLIGEVAIAAHQLIQHRTHFIHGAAGLLTAPDAGTVDLKIID